MDNEQLKAFVKEHLTVELDTEVCPFSNGVSVIARLKIDDEVISRSEINIDASDVDNRYSG